jgi:hypothetical protein
MRLLRKTSVWLPGERASVDKGWSNRHSCRGSIRSGRNGVEKEVVLENVKLIARRDSSRTNA